MTAPEHSRAHSALAALAVIALVLWCLLWGFAHTDLTLRTRPAQLVFFFSAFFVYLIAAGLSWWLGHRATRATVIFVIAAGILFRVTLAPVRPVTTSDIFRYLWEGRVVNTGVNPYREAPTSPKLAALRDWVWQGVDFKQVPAAYPPVAQYVFAIAGRIPAGRIVTLKLILAAFDIGTVLLLPGLMLGLRRPPIWALLYAWHPLIVGEVVARGHLDSVGIFFLVLAIRLLLVQTSGHRALTGAALAAGTLAKGYAIITLPFFLRAARSHRHWLALGFLGMAIAAYLPFASAGRDLFTGIALYSTKWTGYGAVFPLADWSVSHCTAAHLETARRICGLAVLGWLAVLLLKQSRDSSVNSTLECCFLALAGFYVLSPVLYPWYLSWTVPFLCFRPRPGWMILTGTVFIFYAQTYADPKMTLPWLTALEYGVPLCVAVVSAGIARSRRASPESRATDSAEGPDAGETVTRQA
jgi:hypothetical protein